MSDAHTKKMFTKSIFTQMYRNIESVAETDVRVLSFSISMKTFAALISLLLPDNQNCIVNKYRGLYGGQNPSQLPAVSQFCLYKLRSSSNLIIRGVTEDGVQRVEITLNGMNITPFLSQKIDIDYLIAFLRKNGEDVAIDFCSDENKIKTLYTFLYIVSLGIAILFAYRFYNMYTRFQNSRAETKERIFELL